jgi:hypothetical protein
MILQTLVPSCQLHVVGHQVSVRLPYPPLSQTNKALQHPRLHFHRLMRLRDLRRHYPHRLRAHRESLLRRQVSVLTICRVMEDLLLQW